MNYLINLDFRYFNDCLYYILIFSRSNNLKLNFLNK